MAKISIIGVPLDLGASRRGVDMGPSALRIAQIGPRLRELGHDVEDWGNVNVSLAESRDPGSMKAKYLKEITETCAELATYTYDSLKENRIPLVLGGDHSLAVGSVAGVVQHYHERKQKIGMIWLDAHGDINTPATSHSGNIHGMPVAHILGHGEEPLKKLCPISPMIDPKNVVLVGIRDLDQGERDLIKKLGVKCFTMREIDEMGLRNVMNEAIRIACDGTSGFHASFDVDWIDPNFAPGVGTPVPGGATYREGHLAMECICDSGKMVSMDVTELNPILDSSNISGSLAAGMILSAFGKRIL